MSILTAEEFRDLIPENISEADKDMVVDCYLDLQNPDSSEIMLYFGGSEILPHLSDQVVEAFYTALSETRIPILEIGIEGFFGTSPQQQRFTEAIEACDAETIEFLALQPLEHDSFACMLGRLVGSKKDVTIAVPVPGYPDGIRFKCDDGINTLEELYPSRLVYDENTTTDVSSQRQLAVRTARETEAVRTAETQTEADRQRITSCLSAVLVETISAEHGLPMTTDTEEELSRKFQDNFTTKELARLRCVDRHTAGLPEPRNNCKRKRDDSFPSLER